MGPIPIKVEVVISDKARKRNSFIGSKVVYGRNCKNKRKYEGDVEEPKLNIIFDELMNIIAYFNYYFNL